VPLACSCLVTSASAETVIQTTTTQVFSVYVVVSIIQRGREAELGIGLI
jgi:hypothetical protein